ncbi:MAG: magnesium/cobalt transporter CorA [Armatimonadota bacterium]
MLTLYALSDGKFEKIDDISRISDLIAEPDSTVWLDALDPSQEDMTLLAEEFRFHPLAIEDYFTPHNRPKVDEYPGYYFIVAHMLTYNRDEAEIISQEFNLFIGSNYIVTLHPAELPLLDKVARAWNKNPRMLQNGVGLLLYDIMDGLVDSYFPILDGVEDDIDEIEDGIFSGQAVKSAEHIFRLKRSIIGMRRVAAPLRDVFNILIRRDQPLFNEQTITYLRDIYDHVLRIVDTIDTYRDILSGALDAYLTVISNQLNNVMKTLTVITTIFISVQIITGIYGMNFKYMPELHWRYGYPLAITGMIAIALGLLRYFKRIKWL